jgi:hypothetical protein
MEENAFALHRVVRFTGFSPLGSPVALNEGNCVQTPVRNQAGTSLLSKFMRATLANNKSLVKLLVTMHLTASLPIAPGHGTDSASDINPLAITNESNINLTLV